MDLSSALLRRLPQVFSLDQELVTDYQGQNLLLKVRNILAVDRNGEQASVPRSAMAPMTAFVFDPATGSGIKVCPVCLRFKSSHKAVLGRICCRQNHTLRGRLLCGLEPELPCRW